MKDKLLEAVKVKEDAFDLFRNRELVHSEATGISMRDWFGRYGYCQDEFDAILSEVIQTGKATIRL